MNKLNAYLSEIGDHLAVARARMLFPRLEILDTLQKADVDLEVFRKKPMKKEGWTLGEIAKLSRFLADVEMLPKGYSCSTLWRIENGLGGSIDAIFSYAWLLKEEDALFARRQQRSFAHLTQTEETGLRL